MAKGSHQKRLMEVESEIRIYGYDIDVMGIVSNQVYVRWFENLRTAFLDKYWPFEQMLEENISPVLARTEVTYKYPLEITDKVKGKVWVESFSRAKWNMCFEIASEKKIACLGMQTGYVFDIGRKRPVPMPEGLMDIYEAELKALDEYP